MIIVTVRSLSNLKAQVEMSGHHLIADEPVSAGGEDAGPDPYSLLLAALGSCTSMTLHLYAQRKGWPLKAIEITLIHGQQYAQDYLDCETKEGKIDEIRRRIRLEGELDQEQRLCLLEIAAKCPVHRTLTGEIKIRDTLLD
ncbi:MAG: OsmC family protein [Acidobacteriota bacterium]